ncbi:MAG: galK [Polyangiaceae bacterium]|jgi:galactokinase|nr:galK [Polyangiaceae bacterium]
MNGGASVISRSTVLDVDGLKAQFSAQFTGTPQVFSAPGRVNLIGEHTDYNDGFVLPMAIERRTYVAGAKNGTSLLRVKSLTLGESVEVDLAGPARKRRGSWVDFVEGTARALLERKLPVVGCDLLIDSNVPHGAGLSASAALELALGIALVSLGGETEPDRVQLALAGQAAEHQYVGTMCGIMDQYIAALGERDAALLIDCRSLEPRAVPLRLGTARVLVCDTKVKHELSSSEYNVRREECERGVSILSEVLPGLRSLRDVSLGDFTTHAGRLPDVIRRRCLHVVTENERTLAAAEALSRGDLARVGQLMIESHASLRDDYQVSCAELDVAAEVAAAQPGVYGSRMTGGGFGGCTVTLAEESALPAVEAAVKAAFLSRGFREPELFATTACEGARRH